MRSIRTSLRQVILVLTFALAFSPASWLSIVHTHEGPADHSGQVAGEVAGLAHAAGTHSEEGVHAHLVGWSSLQKAPVAKELEAPEWVARLCLGALGPPVHAQTRVTGVHPAAEAAMPHAPPPLLRSMAFLI